MAKGNIFTDRKVMACSISLLILLIGFISLKTLPVEQYPDIAPPSVYVTTTYTGADAISAMESVIVPLEDQINGVENMLYMSSTSYSTGDVEIVVYFKQGTDPDMNTVNVQNRVQVAMGLMPAEVTQVGVTVSKKQNSMLQVTGMVSRDDRFDEQFLSNYIDINVKPRILRVQGVGALNMLGNTYSMRVWLKPSVMAQYGLTPNDVFAALQTQNLVQATGSLGESSANTYQFTMEWSGRLKEVSEFEDIVLRATPTGEVLRLKDVADIELGNMTYTYTSNIDDHPGTIFIVNQTAGSNATEINKQIAKIYEEIKKELPAGVEFVPLYTSDDFLYAAIHNVVETLIIAILLVILVVFFFLQDFRATLIPSISIIVSLLGTFAIVKAAGFSLNIITLFALVLAIGTVVDDAIVVVEAVMAKLESGKYPSSHQATSDAMSEVSMAVISCTLVFMAVFIPVTFMPGTAGTFFTQFGITLASSVGISCICAMTLCPALCVMLMHPKKEGEDSKKGLTYYVKQAYNASYTALSVKYDGWVKGFLKRHKIAWVLVLIAGGVLFYLMKTMPAGLVPQEDQGVMFVNVTAPAGTTLQETDEILLRVEDRIKQIPELDTYARVAGFGLISGNDYSYGMFVVRLKNWDERKGMAHSIDAIMYRFYQSCEDIKEAEIMPFQTPQISGYGSSNSIELILEDRQGGNMTTFYEYATLFRAKITERPEVSMALLTYSESFPKYEVCVDNVQCARAGIDVATVLSTLGAYCGGAYIGNFNKFGKVYRVMVSAAPEDRLDASALNSIFIKVDDKMTPISQFVTLKPKVGSASMKRFNLYQAITCNVSPANGYSDAQAQQAIDEVFKEVFPRTGFGYEYGSMSRELADNAQSNTTGIIYLIAIFLIYLILACLYESWFIPFAVLLSVPFGLMGSFLVSSLCGLDNNIYLQAGVIMLIGLLAKTAILITEFAVEKHKQGMPILEAAIGACQDRFRPILMTVLTMIVGMIPLIIEGGAGAHGNRSLSIGVVGGMTIGIIAILFVVPAFYIVFQSLHDKFQSAPQNTKSQSPITNHQSPIVTTIAILALVVTIPSCGIYKKYQPSTTVETEIYGTDSITKAYIGDTSWAKQSWREIFIDPQLQTLIDTALVRNTDLQVARLNIQQAQANVLQSKLAYLPSIGVAPQVGLNRFISGPNQANAFTYSIPFSASWEIEVFGSITQRLRHAKALAYQAEDVKQATQAQLIATLAMNYYNLVLLDRQLQIAIDSRELWGKSLETQRALMLNGKAYAPAVEQMQASIGNVENHILDIRRAIRRTENAICLLLAIPPQTIERSDWKDLVVPDFHLGAPVDVLANRPDVRAAQRQLEAAYYVTQQARSAFLPKLTLSGIVGWTNSDGTSIFNPAQWILNAVGQLTQPLFQQGKLIAQLRMAKAQQEQARLNFAQTILKAGNEVNEALADFQTAQEKSVVYTTQVAALQAAYEGTYELQQNGKTIYLEVLQTQETLLTAQLSQSQNLYDEVAALIRLYSALGGGTELTPAEQTAKTDKHAKQ